MPLYCCGGTMAERGRPRVALIAGGSGEIGAAVARHLAREGGAIYVGYRRSKARALEVADEIQRQGGRAEPVALDLCDPDGLRRVCADIFSAEKVLDILVNAAALNLELPAAGMDEETWRAVVSVNLDGAFALCREAVKYMLLGRWGRVVNISSIAARRGGRGQVNYAASKAGLESMTRVLALELGRKGVLANCVAPGLITTAMSERIRREHCKEALSHIALHRFGTAGEVAAVVAFLCSEEAGYITGQVIRVDGGLAL